MLDRTLENYEELFDEELRKILKKGDISPTELNNVKEILCCIAKIDEHFAMRDYGESQVSGTHMPHMRFSTGYHSYGDDERNMRSGRRYSYGSEYRTSGHSIKDRMVDKLERMYDEADSDHEKTVIDKAIDYISKGM